MPPIRNDQIRDYQFDRPISYLVSGTISKRRAQRFTGPMLLVTLQQLKRQQNLHRETALTVYTEGLPVYVADLLNAYSKEPGDEYVRLSEEAFMEVLEHPGCRWPSSETESAHLFAKEQNAQRWMETIRAH